MTNPIPHGQVPEALRLAEEISNLACSSEAAAKTIAAAADELCRLHVENASLRAQRPASPPAEQQAAPKAAPGELSADSLRHQNKLLAETLGACILASGIVRKDIDGFTGPELLHFGEDLRSMLEVAPKQEVQEPAKAAPGVGNSGFDHKTAADLLNNKTVSDEAVRKFVAVSRWAHDERAALSATLLAMHGVLTSREAEIALLKKALLEAEAGLIMAGADVEPASDFVPSPTAALRIVRAALLPSNAN